MRDVDVNSMDDRAVERRRGTTYRSSNSRETADSVTLTRSGTGIETRLPVVRVPTQSKGGSIPRAGSLVGQIQKQKAAAHEANQKAVALKGEVLSAQTELKKAQQALEVQKDAGKQDAARSAVRLSLLEEELAVVVMNAITDRGALSKERNVWRGTAAGVAALSLSFLVWWRVTTPHPTQTVAQAPIAHVRAASRSESRKGNGLPADPPAALTMGLDRLNAALAAVPGSSPEEALRKASANSQDCAMVWTNNLPSLLFPGGLQTGVRQPVHLNVLANTLSDCAEAVTRLY